jgi:hypothetical protein
MAEIEASSVAHTSEGAECLRLVAKPARPRAARSKPVNPGRARRPQGRIAELEAHEADRQRALKVEDALYRIADTASSVREMAEFYPAMHAIVGELMDARNFYIALYDEARQAMSFPYAVDELDTFPDPNVWEPMGSGDAGGATAYVIRTGQPIIMTPEVSAELVAKGEMVSVGVYADGDWLGVPLKTEGHTLGALVIQTYGDPYADDEDLLLHRPAHRDRAQPRTRHRGDPRAQRGLASTRSVTRSRQLDQAIIDRRRKGARVFAVRRWPHPLRERGDRVPLRARRGPAPDAADDLDEPYVQVIRSRRSSSRRADAVRTRSHRHADQSWLGVPIWPVSASSGPSTSVHRLKRVQRV